MLEVYKSSVPQVPIANNLIPYAYTLKGLSRLKSQRLVFKRCILLILYKTRPRCRPEDCPYIRNLPICMADCNQQHKTEACPHAPKQLMYVSVNLRSWNRANPFYPFKKFCPANSCRQNQKPTHLSGAQDIWSKHNASQHDGIMPGRSGSPSSEGS